MRQIFRASLAAVTLIGCFGVTPASADTITITSGQVQATLARGSFSVTGDSLFAAAGLPDGWSSTVALNCSPCTANPPVALSFSSTCVSCASSGSSNDMLGGIVYPGSTTFYTNFDFRGPTFSSSQLSADHLTFAAPFTMTGSLAAFTSLSDPNPPFYMTDLVGSGTATISFVAVPGGFFDARNITYDFAAGASPTPEPGSLLLLGSAAALLWRRARRSGVDPAARVAITQPAR